MLISLFYLCEQVCVKSFRTQVFVLFLFPFVWLSARLLWDQMVFTSHTHSLSFSVAHSQEKSHLFPIKTSLSPTKWIAYVSDCVRVISGGWAEFGFAAQQKEEKPPPKQ